jgi:lysophospholipase L1-like esterase
MSKKIFFLTLLIIIIIIILLYESYTSLEFKSFKSETSSIKEVHDLLAKIEQDEKVNIICVGDSITAGESSDPMNPSTVSYPEYLQVLLRKYYGNEGVYVFNSGKSDNITSQMAAAWNDRVLIYNPDLIIFMGGTNDARPVKKVSLKEYESSLKKVISLSGDTPIIILSITPRYKKKLFGSGNFSIHFYRRVCKKIASQQNIMYVDMFKILKSLYKSRRLIRKDLSPDGSHYTTDGYKYIAEIVFKEVFTNKAIEKQVKSDLIAY